MTVFTNNSLYITHLVGKNGVLVIARHYEVCDELIHLEKRAF